MYLLVLFFIFFFFSSRRRHTRFDCDWSSDVCSSDLVCPGGMRRGPRPRRRHPEVGVQPRPRLSTHGARPRLRRAAVVLRIWYPADPGLPRSLALDDVPAPGPRRRSRPDRETTGALTAPRRAGGCGARPRATRRRGALDRLLSLRAP